MLCPRCDRNTLTAQPVSDPEAEVDHCRSCGGLWFGPGSLTRVLAVAARDLRVLDGAALGALVCPACAQQMHRFTYPQTYVTVDMCDGCGGIWLDKGELRELQAVRGHLLEAGELEVHAPVTGLKGALLRFIDTAIGAMVGRNSG